MGLETRHVSSPGMFFFLCFFFFYYTNDFLVRIVFALQRLVSSSQLVVSIVSSRRATIVTIFLLFHLHMSSSRRTVASPPFHFIVSIDSAVCFASMLFTFTCLLLAFRRMYFIHATYMFSFIYLLHAMQAWPICI